MGTNATNEDPSHNKTDVARGARLHKLIISNFRCIGKTPVTIELDDIVVLVGPNNSGKSSVLRAYEVVMQAGKLGHLTLEDFPNARIPAIGEDGLFPTIELETVLYPGGNLPAQQWIDYRGNDMHVRERWTWKSVGAPEKRGFNVQDGKWDMNHGPWGVAAVAQINRPETHRIEAFDDPQKQAEEIILLLQEAIKEKIKEASAKRVDEKAERSKYELLLESVGELQKQVAVDADAAITEVKLNLNKSISDVFPGYVITLDARPEDDLEKVLSFFKTSPSLRMGPANGHQSALDHQGSGTRRTLLWTALRILAEHKRAKSDKSGIAERPHILLLDEPEMCLHPSAIRDACNVLYSLPESGKWQVMITTHSPIFIDLTRNNMSIVRVERGIGGEVSGTTIFRPEKSKLTDNDREELKLLNMFDPYVAEFFFGGRTVIVEGDTEYSVFKEIINSNKQMYGDVHIVRARGKFTIISLCKILNQFGCRYAVLHDSDMPTICSKDGKERADPAWEANRQLLEITSHSKDSDIALVASVPNFEIAMFGMPVNGEKPYNAWEKVRRNSYVRRKVALLLDFLIRTETTVGTRELPFGAIHWTSVEELEAAVKKEKSRDKTTPTMIILDTSAIFNEATNAISRLSTCEVNIEEIIASLISIMPADEADLGKFVASIHLSKFIDEAAVEKIRQVIRQFGNEVSLLFKALRIDPEIRYAFSHMLGTDIVIANY